MATRKTKPSTDVAVVTPMPAIKKDLVLEGDPEKQLEFAQRAAKALMARVKTKPKQVIINGKTYLEFGDWQTLARFFGATVGTEWSQPILNDKNVVIGFEARAIVYQHGATISSAEARCMRTERRWEKADEYAVNSMAQTRASAKALRNAFGWVAELAGYASTPAEEMPGEGFDTSAVPAKAKVITHGADYGDPGDDTVYQPDPSLVPNEMVCADTGVAISKAEYEYSIKFYGKPLSRAAQKNNVRIR